MEKQHKPAPDCEELKCKPDIKIFVSHRIDRDSVTIDDPLYVPVRCGAFYDERENVEMLGDDTGDNISEKADRYGDLTVQYWAAKNQECDYYGFCSSNKYLCIGDVSEDVRFATEEDAAGFVLAGSVSEAVSRFRLDDEDAIRKLISNYDVITVQDIDVQELSCSSVSEYIFNDMYHYDAKVITNLLKVIQYKFPNLLPFANQYLSSSKVQVDAVWIASKEVFEQFAEFQFVVLETLEKRLDLEHAGAERKKLFSFLGSHLWGIFLYYLRKKAKYKIKQLAGVYCKSDKVSEPILPAFSENNAAIVFSSSNAFAPYLGVALKSMMDHISAENNYDIIVLEKSIKDEEKERIYDICAGHDNVSVRFVNTNSVVANVNFYVPTKDLSEETYYTVLVPWLLKNYKKALVLDCDIIINGDVAQLYNTDLGDLYIGAVKELVYLGFLNNPRLNINDSLTEYTEVKLGLSNPYDYFNAGVLLMNLEKFRENYTLELFLDMIDKNQFSIVEQDLLNSVCAGKVLFLSYAWNFMSCLTEPANVDEKLSPSDTTIPNLKLAPEDEIELYKKASEHPYIYHYLTKMKPWKCPHLKYADIWWRVARTTVYYETFLYNLAQNPGKSVRNDVTELRDAVLNVQHRIGVYDHRTGVRKAADKVLPMGSRRRAFAKRLLPKGSLRWRFCKQIYYIFKPQYRPAK